MERVEPTDQDRARDTSSHANSTAPGHDSWAHVVADAAIEAEFATGRHESSLEEAKRHVLMRIGAIVAGFALIGIGIAALPLPGPGWLLIIAGLSLLPFRWAERTILLIRRRIPGVPEEGSIPARTWAVMGTMVVSFSVVSIVWGGDLREWVTAFGNPDRLLG